ncbi:tryptophan halogenase family protein [Neptunicella marina]|uniref:Tryptophan 7-halogenase n=1 Tax=Neptunicella marina TaxID=2125989 RepID=A0A8J6ITK8_9ALTE|nr:tryptophan halogenase family protein [Neptunicella marina]MBC3765600.1 tryptophan 7-halogenase [Neptunicella marina]
MQQKRRIIIVGGGTAGWMSALLLHDKLGQQFDVSLIESPDIGIIGVGEGSTPSLKRFFQKLSISEQEWMPQCNATYKVSIQFNHWAPASGIQSYSHPFISQPDSYSERPFHTNCLTRRLGLDVTTTPDLFLLNGWLAKQGKAPITPANFPFRMEYGYHFDSGKLGQFLAQKAVTLGIKHIQAKVLDVTRTANGDIATLKTDNAGELSADWFVDCSGFGSLLMQQHLQIGFKSFASNLFNDSAVVVATPPMSPLPVQTESTALSNGWAWQIPLTNRTGNGYVYSSRYQDSQHAEQELLQHVGLNSGNVEVRHLKMKVGQIEQHWAHNCIAIGLAQGFIEPLEATALHLVQTTIEHFIELLIKGDYSAQFRDDYNRTIDDSFERVRDYIVAHYKLNQRDDTQYWRDNRNNMQFSDTLGQILDCWFRQQDLTQKLQNMQLNSHFGSTSWHCLLAGLGTFPPLAKDQPGSGDLYQEHDFERFFNGCAMNFVEHQQALNNLNNQ